VGDKRSIFHILAKSHIAAATMMNAPIEVSVSFQDMFISTYPLLQQRLTGAQLTARDRHSSRHPWGGDYSCCWLLCLAEQVLLPQ
jgi:hypothetical protein